MRELIWVIGVLILCIAFVFVPRLSRLRDRRRKKCQQPLKPPLENVNASKKPIKLMVMLGSGGHTAEILSFLWDILTSTDSKTKLNISEVVYLYTYGDTHSARKAQAMHAGLKSGGGVDYRAIVLPRARNVGQSYITSIFSTVRAFKAAFPLVYREYPTLVLFNGPGTCVPIAVSTMVLNGVARRNVKMVYVESVARVKSLSLSGKILYPVVDRFLVQWPQLQKAYPLAEYHGRLC